MTRMSPMARETLHAVLRTAGVYALLLGIYAVLPLRGELWWLGALLGVVALAAIAPVTVRRVRSVLVSERAAFEAAEAVAFLLALLVTGFAAVYFAINHNGSQFSDLDTRIDALYFTVTTLGTVGFGDIAATGQAARVIVTVQIAFDLVVVGLAVRAFALAARLQSSPRARREGEA